MTKSDLPRLLSAEWGRVLAVTLLGGTVGSALVVRFVRREGGLLRGFWIGIVERLFFTVGAALVEPAAIVPVMVAWVGAKMAAGWNLEKDAEKSARVAALAGGLTSMLFALLGGLTISDRIVWT